mgnify:CR=1 FL=1
MIDFVKGIRVFIGDSDDCQLLLNYLKTVDDISNWIIPISNYYQYEIKIVNMKHSKYKQIIRLINLSTEHGIFQRKVNRFKYGFLLLSYWFEWLVDPEIVKVIKKQFNKETTNQIRFNELINIFYFRIINAVVVIIIFLIELMYFFYQ